ncbi:unnamed protein product, partial [marine sediment metagenome]
MGDGAEDAGDGTMPLSEDEKSQVRAKARDSAKDAMTILGIDRHNKSDTTTVNDIYKQLAGKIISGSPYP